MEPLTELAAETFQTQVEEVVQSLTKVKLGYASLGIAIGTAVGGAIAYKIAYSRANVKYEKLATEEIDAMREHFRSQMVAREAKPDLEVAVAERIIQDEGYAEGPLIPTDTGTPLTEPTLADQPEEVRNVFEDRKVEDDWDYEVELRNRSPEKPYIIHPDEQGERGYDTATLTYYAEDDVLCDDKDKPLDEKDEIVGIENLDHFGHGSGDPQVLFVRNDVLEGEFEIFKIEDAYLKVVLGMQHAGDEPRRRRSRERYDDEPS